MSKLLEIRTNVINFLSISTQKHSSVTWPNEKWTSSGDNERSRHGACGCNGGRCYEGRFDDR